MNFRKNPRHTFIVVAAASLAALLCSSAASAQPVANDKEIQLSAGFFHAQGSDSGTVSGDVQFSYLLANPAWQVGVIQGLTYSFIDEATDAWNAQTIPFVNYQFLDLTEDGRFVPFVGAFVGFIWNDRDVTGTVGPNIGAKYYVSPQTFISARYRYEWFFDDFDLGGIDDNRSDGNHVVSLGLGFNWGGDDRG